MLSAQWVWLDGADRDLPNRYADFRAAFSLGETTSPCVLKVGADTTYAVWLNGRFVTCGKPCGFPDDRTYTQLDVSAWVRPGENVLAIQVHYCGVDHFSYIPGRAGLWFELAMAGRVAAASGVETLCRPSPSYTAELTSRITPQRGFTFHHRAEPGARWVEGDYTCDTSWRPAAPVGLHQAPRPWPLKGLDTSERMEGVVVAQGLLRRGAGRTLGERMQHDFLSSRRPWELFENVAPISEPVREPVTLSDTAVADADGVYLLYDLGREACGFIDLELEASRRCVIDIAVGEHVDDLRVRSHVGGRDFASRCVARPGTQAFTHWHHRYAGRYLQLHITDLEGALTLSRVGLVVAAYPVSEVGSYTDADSLANDIWSTARRTLCLCMYEHYEDCPWREQALYANDARNQMLSGYYVFKDYDFARESLDLLLRSTGEDGYQQLCAPMTFERTIPGFTMVWFLALRDYLLYSGDAAYVAQVMPRVEQMLHCYEQTLEGGLLPCPRGDRFWHFYDWAPGLDGTEGGDCTRFASMGDARFDAPLNALWLLALRAVGEVAGFLGDAALQRRCDATADRAAEAMHLAFYDQDRGLYRTYADSGSAPHDAELTQALMLLAGVADDATADTLRRRLLSADGGLVPTTLSQSLYKYEALLQDPSLGTAVRQTIIKDWSRMLRAGATSFWETRQGGWDFHHAGSLCHGWSGIPVYIFGAYGLGVRPTSPGFEHVQVNPVLGISHLSGIVPTPRGEIAIELRKAGERCETDLDLPTGVTLKANVSEEGLRGDDVVPRFR